VEPRSLDHVALWVADRDRIAQFATEHLGVHVVEHTDRFTLLGSDAKRGKLTLFAEEGPRERGALVHVAFRVSNFDDAAARLPTTLHFDADGTSLFFDLYEGVRLGLVEAETDVEYDLDHVALLAPDPERTAREYVPLGFSPAPPGPSGAPRVEVGGAYIEFREGDPGQPERPLLNHIGVLVDEGRAAEAEDLGVDVADVVDGPNTFAVFVWGPHGVKLEYIEHKPTFSLT
jgi:catechol 2,3-dioxygenase-like lactoylglutathione lyase family enzyme